MTERTKGLLLLLAGLLVGALLGRWGSPAPAGETAARHPPGVGPRTPERSKSVLSSSPALEQLRALPYLDGTRDPRHEESGVLAFDRDRSWPGVSLYNSRIRSEALLIDMEGRLIHRWSYPSGAWQHAELLPDGDVLALVKDEEILRLDLRSRLQWRWRGRAHHDLWVDGEERIHAIVRVAESRPEIHPERRVLVDYLVTLSAAGIELDRLSVLDLLQSSPYAYLLPSLQRLGFGDEEFDLDILHTNHIEVFDGTEAAISPLFAAGNLLLSIRNLNAVLIVDPRSGEILWLWGPTNLTQQHHPVLLDNGHLLLFNNGRERSQVLEIEPRSRTVVWRYGPREDFFSQTRGSNQRLPNGNTLITESDTGYVFEVTPEGERVWIFANPDVSADGVRMAIWRMNRFDPAALPFLPARLRLPG